MTNNEIPYRYYNDSAVANNPYLAFTINTTEKSTTTTSDRSTNFLKVDVSYASGTTSTGKTLSATLHLCINAFNTGSPYHVFYPEGITDAFVFPIGGSNNAKYSDLQYPDDGNYYNYFEIYFSIESSGNIGVNITTPNVNGKLLVECTQIFFKI